MATTSMKEIQYLYDYYHLASISVWEKIILILFLLKLLNYIIIYFALLFIKISIELCSSTTKNKFYSKCSQLVGKYHK